MVIFCRESFIYSKKVLKERFYLRKDTSLKQKVSVFSFNFRTCYQKWLNNKPNRHVCDY